MAELQTLTDTWGTDMVTVFVGSKTKKKFVLHKKLLCKEAPFFDRMFNGSFEEAKSQECHLKDDAPSAFELVVSYIYTNRFPDDIKAVSGVASSYQPIVMFYVLADKLLMSRAAKTASLDALIRMRATLGINLHEEAIKFVLVHTAMDCPLRKLFIDMIARDFLLSPAPHVDWLTPCLKDASFEQTLQLLLAVKRFGNLKATMHEDFCKKIVREKRSIASLPEYRVGYLKEEVRNGDEAQK